MSKDRIWKIYLSGEIHTNWREKIEELATLISGKDITIQSIDYAKKILGERDIG